MEPHSRVQVEYISQSQTTIPRIQKLNKRNNIESLRPKFTESINLTRKTTSYKYKHFLYTKCYK